jgi:hypothetical protein
VNSALGQLQHTRTQIDGVDGNRFTPLQELRRKPAISIAEDQNAARIRDLAQVLPSSPFKRPPKCYVFQQPIPASNGIAVHESR